jgi:UDP-N-acetylmuramoyl-tripeptide--D-alanyl-D-alanine ligase
MIEDMRWTLHELAEATGGTLIRPAAGGTAAAAADPDSAGDGAAITGVSIDSRTIAAGELFVAVRSERDGHDFAGAAAANGAAALMVERDLGSGLPEIVVADTAAALLRVGEAARSRLDIPLVGITGSVGKTSTKDMAAAALGSRRRTVASPRSFNNELGLPLTLANAPEDAEVVVLEMGARGPGHIALLCSVARPRIGVVTAVAAAHTEMFGDLEGVAKAKGELVEALPSDGAAVLNADDPRTSAMTARTAARSVLYTTAGARAAEVAAERIELDDQLRPTFQLRSPWGRAQVHLEARGAHQVGNSLAALAVAGLVGVELDAAVAALAEAHLSPHRMEVLRTRNGATVTNPASTAAALRALVALPAARRVAVLGVMAELGDSSREEHEGIAALARDLGVEVIAVGTDQYGIAPVGEVGEIVGRLGEVGSGTAILVKASRVAALEQVALRLTEEPGL